MRKTFLALLALASGPALAANPHVALQTSLGTITVELDAKRAPLSTTNFLKYVDQHLFDGTSFYRVAKSAPGYGFIQGGIRGSGQRTLPPVAHEPTSKTGIHHVAGTISMARQEPGTAEGDFFITTGKMPGMDAHGKDPGFAAFGHVTKGMNVVLKILNAVTLKGGQGAMADQILKQRIAILTAKRVP
ncbi:MAG: peptidylprolyl isomerase [Sphingomonadaceae bacterium]|nr:peptidylprolyl isomerase [Sphingomonadaceae bacterium]